MGLRYRIIMNGNGRFKVQRKDMLRWHTLGQYVYADNTISLGFRPRDDDYIGTYGEFSFLVFDSSEAACKALLDAQARDSESIRDNSWSVVVTDKVQG